MAILACASDEYETETAPLAYGICSGLENVDANGFFNHDLAANCSTDDRVRINDTANATAWRANRMTLTSLVDGASNTLAFAENTHLRSWNTMPMTQFHSGVIWRADWAEFPAYTEDELGVTTGGRDYAYPNSRHPGGFNVALWDGGTRFILDTIDYTVYARLMTSDGRRTQDPNQAPPYTRPYPAYQGTPVGGSEF